MQPTKLFKGTMLAIALSASFNMMSQTATNVFPTKVTTNSKVTILGSGFTTSTVVSVGGISIESNSLTVVSNTEMAFEISQAGSSDVIGTVNVDGSPTDLSLEYIAPTHKTLKNGESSNVTKVTEIFTTYNGFWRSSDWKLDPSNSSLKPNTSHDLLAFTYDGVTYSTGVDDDLLTANGVDFDAQLFYAYTTNGVDGTTHSSNFLAMADMIDGEVGEGTTITSPQILESTIYDVLIDGVNGLDLGTGVTNFNQLADVEFYSSGGQLGAVNDAAPDFLVTQIAQAGSTDIYYYADESGNVVGRPVKLTILDEAPTDGDALLAKWRLDLYTFLSGVNYGVATPISRTFSAYEERPLRMAAFRFEDFEITEANIAEINNINMVAGGTADLAFLAYNRGSFDIKTPVFSQYPVSQYVCKLSNASSVTFTGMAEVSGGATGAPEETLSYQWYKYNNEIPGATSNSYTVSGDVTAEDLGTYKLKVTNDFGSVIVPVTLSQGGTPVFWNGTSWELPPAYVAAGISVSPEERGLVFSSNYNESGDLEGCDCLVPSGSDVVIPSGTTLKLYSKVEVESGGTLTFADGANLIQTKEVAANENIGDVIVERNAEDLHLNDFIYWSSPVQDFDVANVVAPYASSAVQWDVNAANNGFVGDWVSASGNMVLGEGYAVSVPEEVVATGFTASFEGVPNNGTVAVDVYKSVGAVPSIGAQHWNLLGNPYPSAVNAHEFLNENTFLEGNIWLWAHDMTIPNVETPLSGTSYQELDYLYGESYISYNYTGVNPPETFNGNIASGQGFFVQVDDSAELESVLFTNAMRIDDTETAYDNSQFYRVNVPTAEVMEENKELLWLSLINSENVSASTLVGYVNGATLGKDRLYDAYSDGESMSIYSMIDDSKMVIQGRPMPFDATDVVPLGINIPSEGPYTIAIGDLMGDLFVDAAQGIYLEDTYLGVQHDLRQSPYTFTGVAGATDDRFNIIYAVTLSVDEINVSDTFAYIAKQELVVQSKNVIKEVKVYDLTGKLVTSYYPKGNNDTSFRADFQFAKGVYLTSIILEGGTQVSKKLIN